MPTICQFCQSASHRFGDLFCSGTLTDNSGNGAIVKQATEADSGDHVARLTVFSVQNGLVHFLIDGRSYILSPGMFLLLNPGQRFVVSWKSTHEVQLFAVGFGTGFATEVLQLLMASEPYFAEGQETTGTLPVQFFNHPNQPDNAVNQLLERLFQHTTRASTAIDTEALFGSLLERLFQMQRQVQQTISQLGPVKPSTRIELYNRLSTGRDFIEANLHRNLSLDEVASEACLSKFHFMRLFKQAFGQTVHQYITARRLSRTRLLLQLEEKSFPEICRSMGYEDVAWFAKVYKRAFGTPPVRHAQVPPFRFAGPASALAVA